MTDEEIKEFQKTFDDNQENRTEAVHKAWWEANCDCKYDRLMSVLTKLRDTDMPSKAEVYDRVVDVEVSLHGKSKP